MTFDIFLEEKESPSLSPLSATPLLDLSFVGAIRSPDPRGSVTPRHRNSQVNKIDREIVVA